MRTISKISVITKTYRHFNRYRQIIMIVIKYGFGDLVDGLKIDRYLEGVLLVTGRQPQYLEKLSRPARVRMILEELGPTFIKMGQILSIRPDLIPIEYVKEFTKLQDQVPEVPFCEIKQIIEKELCRKIEDFFEFICEHPIAAASIGQVHKARIKGDEEVAIKIQRPGIEKMIEVDLEILFYLATLLEKNSAVYTLLRPVKIVEEFAKSLEKEIDYRIEAKNLDRMAIHFDDDQSVHVPKVFHEHTTRHVLIMEYINGIKVSEIRNLEKAGLNRRLINERGVDYFFRQVFENGFFHADPHPGNIFVLSNNVICFIDFGMMGWVEEGTRETFINFLDSIIHDDIPRASRVLLAIMEKEACPDMEALETALELFIKKHVLKPIKDIQLGQLFKDLVDLAVRHQLSLPADLYLMMRAFATFEGVSLILNPGFNIITHAQPMIERIRLSRLSPHKVIGKAVRIAEESAHLLRQVPRDVATIMQMIQAQDFKIKVDHQHLEQYLTARGRMNNKIVLAIIIAALLIGAAMIMASGTPPLIGGVPVWGLIFGAVASLLGCGLLLSMFFK